MRRKKNPLPVLAAIIAALTAVFIATANDKPSECFTWRVEINESTFYLCGSIHAAAEANYPLPKAYMRSYKKANTAIFELEDDLKTLGRKIFAYAEKDSLSEEFYLDLFLSDDSKRQLERIIKPDKLIRYYAHEAWLLNMTIAGSRSILNGYNPELAIDKYFHDLAIKDHKKILGLDDIETQLALFEFEAPHQMQIKIIENAVAAMENIAKQERPLYDAYFAHDLDGFEKAFLKPYDFSNPQIKDIYDRVFIQRNTSWVDQLEKLSSDKPDTYFVLVGAGHYFGPGNVRELLEDRGYTLEKI